MTARSFWVGPDGRPSWYSWVAVVLVPLLASTAVLIVSLRVNQRSIEREQMARHASEQATCEVWVLLDDLYRKTPPATESGRALARVVANLRTVNHCTPRSK